MLHNGAPRNGSNEREGWGGSRGGSDGRHQRERGPTGGGKGQQRSAEEEAEDEFHFAVSRDDAMKLIGKGGAMIKAISSESGAKLNNQPEEGVVTISGSVEAVDKARVMVCDVLNNEELHPKPGEWEDEVYMMVKADVLGLLIGTQGRTRKNIEQATWAHIEVGKQGGPVVRVRISGDFAAVQKARRMALETIAPRNGGRHFSSHDRNGTTNGKRVVDGPIGLGSRGQVPSSSSSSGPVPWQSHPRADATLKRKRSDENGDSFQQRRILPPPVKPQHASTIQLSFSSDAYQAVVGRGGEKLQDVKSRTGAAINHERNPDGFSVRIMGTPENVAEAKALIERLASSAPDRGSMQETATSPAPSASEQRDVEMSLDFEKEVGRMLRGRIRQVEQDTGTKVHITDIWNGCEVKVKGPPWKVQIALKKVEELAKSATAGVEERPPAAEPSKETAASVAEKAPLRLRNFMPTKAVVRPHTPPPLEERYAPPRPKAAAAVLPPPLPPGGQPRRLALMTGGSERSGNAA